MEQKRIKVRLTKNSPYSDYGYYEKGDIGYIDGYVNDNAVIILENGKFAKADLRWIEVVNEEDKNVNTELKESEDEKIRKELLNYLYDVHDDDEERSKWIAWLEKQGEHKKFRDSIQVGDKVTKNEDGVLVNLSQLSRVAKKDEQILANSAKTCKDEQKPTDVRTTGYWHVEDVEQKPAKVEPKFKIGDRVIGIVSSMQYYITEVCDDYYYTESGCAIMFYAQDNFELYKQNPAEWSEEDEKKFNVIWNSIDCECLAANGVDAENTHEWLLSLKDRVQPKQEWNDEEKRALNDAIVALSMYANGNIPNILPSQLLEDVEQLKSLNPQSQWKPTEEQIKALESATENCAYSEYQDCLRELIGQLKKLKD